MKKKRTTKRPKIRKPLSRKRHVAVGKRRFAKPKRRPRAQNTRTRAATKKRPLRRHVTRHRTVTKRSQRPAERAREPLYVLTADGVQELPVKGRKDATLVGKHWNAVRAYVVRGESAGLGHFDGLQVTDDEGDRFRLLTDVVTIEHLANAGVLSFETIYARTR